MRGLFDGILRLYVHANDVRQITKRCISSASGLAHLVIVGGTDAPAVVAADNNVPVMVKRVHSLPRFAEDDVNAPFRLAKELETRACCFACKMPAVWSTWAFGTCPSMRAQHMLTV